MNWSKGIMLESVSYDKFHGVIQKLEGLPYLFAQVETPEKENIIGENLHNWAEAEKWVESKIFELASNKQSI
jgi:hypothetical protein